MNTPQHRCVFVGNIPYDATEEQLVQICEEVGPVVSFRLVIDRETGKPKGYGFCEYRDEETAASARRNLQGYEINGRQLRVDYAENDKGVDRNREQGRGGPGLASGYDNQKQTPGSTISGDPSYTQPIGLSVAAAAASVMAKALGEAQTSTVDQTHGSGHLRNNPGGGNDPLTLHLASLSKKQLYDILHETKVLAQQNRQQAQQLLVSYPSLAKAIFQAQIILGMVSPQMALNFRPVGPTQAGQHSALQSGQSQLKTEFAGKGQPQSQNASLLPLAKATLELSAQATLPSLSKINQNALHSVKGLSQGMNQPQQSAMLPQPHQVYSQQAPVMPSSSNSHYPPLLRASYNAGVQSRGLKSSSSTSHPRALQANVMGAVDIVPQGHGDLEHLDAAHGQTSLTKGITPYTPVSSEVIESSVGFSDTPMNTSTEFSKINEVSDASYKFEGRKPEKNVQPSDSGSRAEIDHFPVASRRPLQGSETSQHALPQEAQLPPEIQSALLQQVMSLTPEQIRSLPPEQQQQILQLQKLKEVFQSGLSC